MRLIEDYFLSRLPTTNQGAQEIPFQRWFHFKEAYSPSLVISVMKDLGLQKGNVLDPFGGSGTTAMTARLLGMSATTIEVNPFLADIIKAKTVHYNLQDLRADQLLLLHRFKELKPALIHSFKHLPPTFIEGSDKKQWIFNTNIAKGLSKFLKSIELIDSEDNKRLFRILLGSCLVPVSNIYISGKGRRYRKDWKSLKSDAESLEFLYKDKLKIAINDIAKFEDTRHLPVKVIHGDARKSVSSLKEEYDFVMFSPPYPNSFDYTDVYNVELWTLKYLSNFEENRALRKNTLRSHVQVRHDLSFSEIDSASLEKCYKELSSHRDLLWDKKIPEMVYAYFDDLRVIMKEICLRLKKNGHMALVVGDSQYSGIKIPVADILTEMSKELGMTVISNKPARSMRTSPQQGGKEELGEHLIVFSRS